MTAPADDPTPVLPLRALGRGDLGLAGGKGANLGALVRAGFPVPDGFVVTTRAYAAVAEPALAAWSSRPEDDPAGARGQLSRLRLPEDLGSAVRAAYGRLGAGPVAVRSSATAEDLPGAAFAGQQDSYLNVADADAVLDAVRRCWASLWTDRAVAYRRAHGVDRPAMAVVVQRMVDADQAGVLFTADPVTGRRDRLVVEASSGLGEAVVAGLVTPDHYVLDPDGRVREWTAGGREVVVRSRAGGGVEHAGGSADPERLPDPVLHELARLAGAAARSLGAPQDVEWAWDGRRVWLLQARPITALPPQPVAYTALQREFVAVLGEYLPERPYPIDVTTWLPHGPAGLMGRVAARFGVTGVFDHLVHEADGVVDRLNLPAPRVSPRVLLTPWRMLILARQRDPGRWRDDPRFRSLLADVAALQAEDLRSLPWPDLQQVPRRVFAAVRPVAALRGDYLPRVALGLLRLGLVLTLLGRRASLPALLAGAPTRTADLNLALEDLAASVRGDPDLAAAVARQEVDRSRFPGFWAAVDNFVAEHGHRETTSPILISPPTLGEDLPTLLGIVGVLAATPPRGARPADAKADLLASPVLRRLRQAERVGRWVDDARVGVAFREDTHYYMTLAAPVLRRALLEMGRRLAEAGVLAAPPEVFHLRLAELEALGDPATLPPTGRARLAALVSTRAARRAALAGTPLLPPDAAPPRRCRTDPAALVAGVPAGGGRATGPVRVVLGPSGFSRLRDGDVLVCPYTNPAWTPLFARVAAVVADSGGLASHAAIVAREYGIAAVMGTGTGTTTLVDDQRVTVDGRTGLVTAADWP